MQPSSATPVIVTSRTVPQSSFGRIRARAYSLACNPPESRPARLFQKGRENACPSRLSESAAACRPPPPASGGRALPSPLWIIAVRQQLLCRDGRSRGIHEFFQIRFYARRRAKHQIPLRFPGTGHDIGRNRGMWEIASQAAAKRFIFRAGVMPFMRRSVASQPLWRERWNCGQSFSHFEAAPLPPA